MAPLHMLSVNCGENRRRTTITPRKILRVHISWVSVATAQYLRFGRTGECIL